MKKNVIILTSGLSGSSVLTALIARAGYWTGDATFKKSEYDTFENRELIDLNLKLFEEAGYKGNYLVDFPADVMTEIAGLHRKIDGGGYRRFVEHCDGHQPWIWKDPRLWLTIRFWTHFLDLDRCQFILLTRGPLQSWISSTLRRQITTFRYSRDYEARIRQSIVEFLAEIRAPYLHVEYEALITSPAPVINDLNQYLKTNLTIEDLKKVYHKPLYRNPRNSVANHVKALLIYVKNYSERLDLGVQR